ncbi:MAG: hypothetical protein Q9170_003525 [Blastenia crenularia]
MAERFTFMRSLPLVTCLLSLSHRLVNATTQSNIHSSQTEEIIRTQKISSTPPIDNVFDTLRRHYAYAVEGRVWDMVQLIALCCLLGFFSLWRKKKATERRHSESRGFVAETSTEVDKKANAASTKTKDSVAGTRSTDPGLLKKHSSLRSYTTSYGHYPAIRVFKREHPQADKLPSKPTPLPLLVFIHGLGGALAQFHPLLTSLVNVAPCLGIDLPGCGLSSFSPTAWPAYSQQALVELLATIIAESCQGSVDQGVILIGHSMGCSLAALLASSDSLLKSKDFDVLGLVAICPKAVPPTDQQLAFYKKLLSLPTPILDLWRLWDRRGGPESASVARFVGPGAHSETKRLQERFNVQSQSAVWRRMAWGLYHNQDAIRGRGKRVADLDTWAQLTVPILLVAGESDKITSPDEVTAIGRVLGKIDRSSSERSRDATPPSGLCSSKSHDELDDIESNAETTILGGQELSLEGHREPLPSFTKRRQVLKTTILPEPAAHSLLYDPTTYRTLAGLVQKFLWDHVDSRLSLGWQLQYLSTEGKWDVKNLAKWQAVRPVSEPIAGIFRAMKTLREVDDEHCPAIFVRSWKGKLKAVVDISHEAPVYDPRGLDKGGIEYYKFPTVSKIPPTAEEVQDFIKLIDRIRQTDSATAFTDALIGVHCHYGFNRTGFFVCSYLIEKEKYGVQQAIDEFQARRPPGIRHEHFLDTLFIRSCVGLKRAPTL